jgi:hypothetical protein
MNLELHKPGQERAVDLVQKDKFKIFLKKFKLIIMRIMKLNQICRHQREDL